MAKKKESSLKSWAEVDNKLKRLGELQIKKAELDGRLTNQINTIKESYTKDNEVIVTEMKEIEKDISRYCDANKDSFLNKRNKKLNFGLISYRLTEKVVCKCVESTIKCLKSLNLDWCLRIKEEVNKDSLKELDSKTLEKIGVSIVKEDKITIEPDIAGIVATNN